MQSVSDDDIRKRLFERRRKVWACSDWENVIIFLQGVPGLWASNLALAV